MLLYILFLALVILKSSTLLKHRDLVASVAAYIFLDNMVVTSQITRQGYVVHAQMFDCCVLCSTLV